MEGSGAYMVLRQSGTQVTGTAGPDADQQWSIQNGKLEDNKFTGEVHDPNGAVYKVSLILAGDRLNGDCFVTTADGQSMQGKLAVERVK